MAHAVGTMAVGHEKKQRKVRVKERRVMMKMKTIYIYINYKLDIYQYMCVCNIQREELEWGGMLKLKRGWGKKKKMMIMIAREG